MARNPVIFAAYEAAAGFIPFSTVLHEFAWRNRLVGMTDAGLLYVETKVPRSGYYEFHPKLLPWKDVVQVTTSSTVSIGGVILGAVAFILGLLAFGAVWIRRTHVGGLGFMLVGLLAGPALILGARRNLIRAKTGDGSYKWMSGPLCYSRTVEICRKMAEYCQKNRVLCTSHVRGADDLP